MQPHAPFTGVLLLPDLPLSKATSTVTCGDGEPVAVLRWRRAARKRFEILDARSGAELAHGGPDRLFDGFQLHGPDEAPLLQLAPGLFGPAGWGMVTLPDRRRFTARGSRSRTVFSIEDGAGRLVAQILTGSRAWGMPQSQNLAFELRVPTLSIVQAVGLAQCIRVGNAARHHAGSHAPGRTTRPLLRRGTRRAP
jgi:hypothetical protein